MKIRIILISKSDRTIEKIKDFIRDEELTVVADSPTGSVALDKIENISPDVVIMPLGAGDTDILSLAERIISDRPRIQVILLAEQLDMEVLQKAIKIGAHNIIEFPTDAKEFGQYIKSVHQTEMAKISSLTNGKKNLSWMSRVVTIFGPKGGLGKTTIAVNLAARLAQMDKKVVLVDLDLQFGDVHIFLDIEPTDTIAELVQEFFASNIDSVRSFMTVHSTGIHVLCSPKSPEYAETISAEKIQSLLSLLRSYYDYVIIDTPPFFTEVVITALESSSTILFVTGLDISILKNSKVSLALLDSLQMMDKTKLIINRAVDMSSISVEDVRKILGQPIWAKIPSDYKVAVTALNRGVPFVTSSPSSKLSQSIDDIAGLLYDGESKTEISPKAKTGLFKKKK